MIRKVCFLMTLSCISCAKKNETQDTSNHLKSELNQQEAEGKKKQNIKEIDAEIYRLMKEQQLLEKQLLDSSN